MVFTLPWLSGFLALNGGFLIDGLEFLGSYLISENNKGFLNTHFSTKKITILTLM